MRPPAPPRCCRVLVTNNGTLPPRLKQNVYPTIRAAAAGSARGIKPPRLPRTSRPPPTTRPKFKKRTARGCGRGVAAGVASLLGRGVASLPPRGVPAVPLSNPADDIFKIRMHNSITANCGVVFIVENFNVHRMANDPFQCILFKVAAEEVL